MINRSFPSNWTVATLGEISSYIQRGKSPKYVESSPLAVINQKCIRWNQLQTEHQKYIHPEQIPTWDANRHIRQGDILWNSTGTGTVGRAYLVKSTDCQPQKVVDSHVTIVRSNAEVDSRIIFYWIKGPNVQNRIEELCDGSTNQVELSRTAISEIKIPLPPISEQRRIADKLDRVLARVDAANEHLSRVAPLIKRFRQSVLAAATSGRLTEDWRKHDEYQTATVRMDEIGKVSGGLTKNTKRAELPLRKAYLRVANVYPNEVRLEDVLEIGLTESEYEKTKLTYGDLLIVEGNGSIDQIGRVAMWKDELPECSHQNHLIRWRRSNLNIAPEFILAYLMSPAGRKQIISAASSTSGLHTLSVSKISALELNIPPLEEQTEIVRRVEKLFAFADRLEERLSLAQAAVQKLTPALLAKAFRGELVPQDPNDEPASKLLKRLQENRSESTKPSRARKPRARKSP